MEEFNDGFPNYEVLAQHDNEAGVGVRKRLMNVFWFLCVVTIIELFVGFYWSHFQHAYSVSKTWLIMVFVMFTLLKAGYIVMSFMHLGDENKWMRWMILGPYCLFIVYLIYMVTVTEGNYSRTFRDLLDPITKTAAPAGHHE